MSFEKYKHLKINVRGNNIKQCLKKKALSRNVSSKRRLYLDKFGVLDDDDSSSDTDAEEEDVDRTVDLKHVLQGKPLDDKVSNTKETEAGTEISVLVNYCQSVQFTSFENAESKFLNNSK